MKQRGKRIGYFNNFFAMDCETTGLCFKNYDFDENVVHNPNSGEHHQALSWGIMVVDTETFEVHDKLYVEIKWNETSKAQRAKDPKFGRRAEQVHKLTYEYLEEHGVEEEQAVIQIANLITKYLGTDNAIKVLAHNPLFDIAFLRDLFKRFGVKLKFGSRVFDTNSLGLGTTKAWNSDDLFETMGNTHRESHNALDDIEQTVQMFKNIQMLWRRAYPDLVAPQQT